MANPIKVVGDDKKEVKKEEVVTISKQTLNDILAKIERLESASDKKSLLRYDLKNKKELGKTVNIYSLDGKVVVSWRLTKNVVEKDWRTMAWREEQEIELTYEDGKKDLVPYVQFSRNYVHIPAKVISETVVNKGEDGEEYEAMFELRTLEEDGEKTYKISSKFVN